MPKFVQKINMPHNILKAVQNNDTTILSDKEILQFQQLKEFSSRVTELFECQSVIFLYDVSDVFYCDTIQSLVIPTIVHAN